MGKLVEIWGYTRAAFVGVSVVHTVLALASAVIILVERNPLDKCQRDQWERDWDAGRVPKTVSSASNFYLSLVLIQF